MNRLQVHSYEQVGVFLSRLEEEQHLLTKHAHAPTAAIYAQLNPGDDAAFHAGRRQLLNWNPGLAELVAGEGKSKGKLFQVEGFTEVMLEWHRDVVGLQTAVLVARSV